MLLLLPPELLSDRTRKPLQVAPEQHQKALVVPERKYGFLEYLIDRVP